MKGINIGIKKFVMLLIVTLVAGFMVFGEEKAIAGAPVGMDAMDECDPDPRTQGFWRRVCKKAHPAQPDRSILTDELCADLNPDPNSDPCERARSQFAAVLYNLDSDRLQGVCIVEDNGESLADTVAEIEALIADGTDDSCKEASGIAASINEGDVS